MSEFRPLITALGLLLLAVLVLYLAMAVFSSIRPGGIPRLNIGEGAPLLPTGESAQIARSPQSFDAFVSITDRGFEPSDISVASGKTVRFTNNSKGGVRIAAAGDDLYPAAKNGCSASAFDSCKTLAPGEFWEFTFDEQGVWQYRDRESEKTGVVRVK